MAKHGKPESARPPAGRSSGGARRVRPEEQALWRTATRDVRPLAKEPTLSLSVAKVPRRPPEPPSPNSEDIIPVAKPYRVPLPSLQPGPLPGVDRRTARALARGESALDAKIDLHGHTLESAARAVHAFIEGAHERGNRSLLVITGRGKRTDGGAGTIKESLPHWLNGPRLRPLVLAFTAAKPRHGGEGAFYVLLRKKR